MTEGYLRENGGMMEGLARWYGYASLSIPEPVAWIGARDEELA
jgi:hypothetical protein